MWKLFDFFLQGNRVFTANQNGELKKTTFFIIIIVIVITIIIVVVVVINMKVLHNVLLSFVSTCIYYLKNIYTKTCPGLLFQPYFTDVLNKHPNMSVKNNRNRDNANSPYYFCLTYPFLHLEIDGKKTIFLRDLLSFPALNLYIFTSFKSSKSIQLKFLAFVDIFCVYLLEYTYSNHIKHCSTVFDIFSFKELKMLDVFIGFYIIDEIVGINTMKG